MTFDPHTLPQAADILVVDDNIDNLRLLTEILTKAGYPIRSAEKPRLALESALAFPPGLILLDVMMPDMDGYEVCQQLKAHEHTREVPIIFISALQNVEDKVRGFEAGGVDFISKPFQKLEVLARVRIHLQLREMQLHLEQLVAERTAALRESEVRLRAIFDYAPMGIAVAGPDSIITEANPAFQEIIGYTPEELQEINVIDLSPPEDNERELPSIQEVFAGKRDAYALEKRFKRKDGGEVWVEMHSAAVRDENGKIWFALGIVQDITERRQVEQALRDSEEKFRAVIDQSPVSIQIHGLDGMLQQSNPAYAKLYALSDTVLDELYKKYNIRADEQSEKLGVAPYVEKVYSGENVRFPAYKYDGVDTLKTLDFENPVSRKCWVQTIGFPLKDRRGSITSVVFMSEDITQQKKADKALKASEEEFRQLMEQSPVSIQLLSPEGKITRVNRAFMDLWGVSEDELPDIIAQYNILEDEEARKQGVMPLIEKAFQGDPVVLPIIEYKAASTMDALGLDIEANKVWIQSRLYPVKNLDGDIVGIVDMEENITARKQAEQKMRESEERFRATFEQAAVGIAHVAPDGLFLRINQKFCDIVGYSCEEMEKLTFQRITHPDDLDNDLQQVERLLAGQMDSYTLEKRYYHKNGKTVWINLTVSLLRKSTGEPDYFVGVIEDITGRKAVEQALHESELKYRSLVEQATDAIILIQNDVIKFANTRFAEITGYTFEGLQDTLFTRYLPAEERPILLEMYQHRHDEETPAMVESLIQHKDGSRIEVELNGDLTTYEGKSAVLVFIRDITNRKRVEREIQSYQGQLKALASQLTLTEERERRRIAAELHDHVGQSLAFTRMQIAAAQKAKTDARHREILDEVSETLKETIQETRSLIFDLSSPLMNELGLNAAITEWLQERVEKGAGLKTEFIEIGPDLPMAEDVRAILFRNLRELLSNVIRHAQATSVRVTLEQTDTQARIMVEDDGVGFDWEAFTPSVTRTGRFGLFSIQERMHDMGGSLEIDSAPGKGCRSTLTLPHQAV